MTVGVRWVTRADSVGGGVQTVSMETGKTEEYIPLASPPATPTRKFPSSPSKGGTTPVREPWPLASTLIPPRLKHA